jgi:hypothetical protein
MMASEFEKVDQFREELMRFVEEKSVAAKFDAADVLYALTATLVLTAYVNYGADRAKARDMIGGSMDTLFTGIDEAVRSSPAVFDLIKRMNRARDAGQMASVERMLAEAGSIIAKAKKP